MAEYGTYSSNDSIVGIFRNGKLERIIENVTAETVFLHEDYSRSGVHSLDFGYTENGVELQATVEILPEHSFAIYPSWMADKLRQNI